MTNVEIKVVNLDTGEQVDLSDISDFMLKTRYDGTLGLYTAINYADSSTDYDEVDFPFEMQITLF